MRPGTSPQAVSGVREGEAECIIPNCRRRARAHEAFCAKHRANPKMFSMSDLVAAVQEHREALDAMRSAQPDPAALFEAIEAAWVAGTDTPTIALQNGQIWIGEAAFDAHAILRFLSIAREAA